MIDDVQIHFRTPSKPILELADFVKSPDIAINPNKNVMIMLYRNTYKNLEDLNQEEARLAGLRIHPKKRISSTISFVNNLKIKKIHSSKETQVTGLPEDAKIAHLIWSPDERKIAFTHTDSCNELWILDINTAKASKLCTIELNAGLGNPITWFPDGKNLLVNVGSKDREYINPEKAIPSGPSISENKTGKVSNNRTYQDLLKSKVDEENFDTLTQSELHVVDLDGKHHFFKEKQIYSQKSFSPDGNFLLLTTIHRPYSYNVPINRFPFKTEIFDTSGKFIKLVNEVPLSENLPKGFMSVREGKRNLNWRSDKAHTLYYVEALDKGDQSIETDFRDVLYSWTAPFHKEPVLETKIKQRFGGIIWGDEKHAVIFDQWYDTRNVKTYLFNPSTRGLKTIFDRNFQDIYADPGDFQTKKNEFGRQSLFIHDNKAYLIGEGYHQEGQNAFVDAFDLKTLRSERLYQSKPQSKQLEKIITIIENGDVKLLVNIQSKDEYPNYYLRNLDNSTSAAQITFYENPFKGLNGIEKKIVRYIRQDGVKLSGTLYLPENRERKPLPLLIWAYPSEYKDKNSAGQSTAHVNEFAFPHYGSFLYYAAKGYAVLDDAAFPIIGEDKHEPNDTFIEQLQMNAEAAIQAVEREIDLDKGKIAIGGHSYGAFMTASLLTHTDLFTCGIARSGAYNRTLTPFGFQTEQRNYWDVPEIYNKMSPFMSADKMKTPLLLVHGAEDNNPGTFTLQTERYYQALNGLGAPVRMVLLPKEGHSYQSKENIFHLLWEQEQFLDQHLKTEASGVKNKQ